MTPLLFFPAILQFGELIGQVDWNRALAPQTPLLETLIRGTAMYLALFLMLRVILRRQSATLAISDLLVIVLIADAAQNGLADDYTSITDGLALVAVILFWSYVLDWLEFHVPALQRLMIPPPLDLIKDGRILWRNMRKELVSEAELMSQLREHGVEKAANVKVARMESDGRISVISYEKPPNSEHPPGKKIV